ncbi:MAG TPA: class III extradiol dioxygenase subunit B-like domain-containing protein [Synergistales bacterium]|nr:class III extradiol dioxygenase subunit B-like domain-containing protein [Synergistales bacterium]
MWTMGFLLPHAPILVPEVAARSGSGTGKTLEGLRSLGGRLKELAPDHLLVLDPHAVSDRTFTLINPGRFVGDLGNFGAPSVSISLKGAAEEGERLIEYISSFIPSSACRPSEIDLDYAAVVSLHLLGPALCKTPSMILANPVTIDHCQAYELGRHLREFVSGKKWGLLASGDLSHRLTRDAPSGFHPDGRVLDEAIVESLKRSSPDPVLDLPGQVIRNAGECGLRSVLALIGLSMSSPIEVLSYESPFGVGYATALLDLSGEGE